MRQPWLIVCLLPLLAGAARAQDERRVASPNGQLEFRIFTFMPEGAGLNTLAYQVWLRGKQLIDTSYLGINIHFQEPYLGENLGLSSTKEVHETNKYNGLILQYLQTSTTGRRVSFEVRVWDNGLAFRYLIPRSTPLMELLIEDEGTEFHFAGSSLGEGPPESALPFIAEQPGAGWVGIYEAGIPGFPAMHLVRSAPNTLVSRLPQKPTDPGVAYEGATPFTYPWRILVVSADRAGLAQGEAQIARDLTSDPQRVQK